VSLISNQQTIPIDDSDHIRVSDTREYKIRAMRL